MTWTIRHIPASRTKSLAEAIISDADGKKVCSLHGSQIKHAPLLLAAPLMLEALKAQEMVDYDRDAALRKGYWDRALELRAAALKKAGAFFGG